MLTKRQLNILQLIIQLYTTTGVPVGSKTLMNQGIDASSATIRNDMMVLENQGLITKTHSSSGRIPSVAGYRYYVDHLLEPEQISKTQQSDIQQFFQQKFYAMDEVVEKSARELSKLTKYTAFSSSPEMKERKLLELRMVPLRNHQIIAVVVTNTGNSESHVFRLPESMESEEVEKVFRLINDQLTGENISVVYQKLQSEIPSLIEKYFSLHGGINDFFDMILEQAFEERIFVSGKMNLLDFGSVTDVDQFKSIYTLVSDPELFTELIIPTSQEFEIRIGQELENELLSDMALISTTYEVRGYGRGAIALLGPKNMPYAKNVGLLDTFRTELSKQLTRYYESFDSQKTC